MAKVLQMSLLFEALLDSESEEQALELPVAEQVLVQDDALSGVPFLEPAIPRLDVADAAMREAALDIRQSCIVEAPAGSGKTGLLIQRFLKLLAYGGVEKPEDVLAITFTRKADAEMRHRVLAQLASARAGVPLAPDATAFEQQTRRLAEAALKRDEELGWDLLESPRQLNIRTIDSFCAELAGSTPLIAGTGGRYSPAEDPTPFYLTAAERTLLHMGGKDPVLTKDLEVLLLHRDAQPGDFLRLLATMLRQREQWGELLPLRSEALTDASLDRDIRPRLNRTLRRLLRQELEVTADLVGADLLQRLASLAHSLSTLPGYNGEISPIVLCERLPHAPTPAPEELAHWVCLSNLLLKGDGDWRTGFYKNHLGFEAGKAEQQQIRDLIDAFRAREQERPGMRQALEQLGRLPEPDYPEEQWRIVKALCRTLHHALVELQLVFNERRSCDFSEITLTAKALLRSESAAADLLNTSVSKLRHLLVDEMQDTSAGQYELLEMLTASWDGVTQTVFLVGDPKQSIYEFRQARVERFRRVMEQRRFGQLVVASLRLSANFRSQANLIREVNATFRQIFPAPETSSLTSESVDVPFVEAVATRPATTETALVWHMAEDSSASDREQEGDAEQAEAAPTPAAHARVLRGVVEHFIETWPWDARARPPKIAVLARGRAHLAPVIQEFHQDRGKGKLPFRAVDVEALAERPEILDLLALTRALLHPADRIAWLAVLRSPMCGLSLGDLLELTGDGPETDLHATVSELVSERSSRLSQLGQQLLARVWPYLRAALHDVGRTAFSTHVERTWRSLGGDLPLQPHERANALRFLNLLQECERGPEDFSLSLLTRRLRTLYAGPSAPDALVELMTIHKAKGLEWDLVVVPALHRGSGRNDAPFLKWLEFDTGEGGSDLLLAPIQSKGDKSSRLSDWLTRRQQQREAAEAKRLLYVALTRAREELHLFGTVTRRSSGRLATPLAESLLAAAWPAVESFLKTRSQPGELAPIVAFPVRSDSVAVFSLAASGAETDGKESTAGQARPQLGRLPQGVDPSSNFCMAVTPLLSYPAAENLGTRALFARPEGSFAARAFGNVVHRFLELMAARLADGTTLPSLEQELATWESRLVASLRNEGIATSQAKAEARRALSALTATLRDPEGAWLLSPQQEARNETTLAGATLSANTLLRADRTFVAGPLALGSVEPSHLWIVDYKTAELGGRSRAQFLEEQRSRYEPQMRAYAEAAVAAGNNPQHVVLALYFPLVPTLLYWPFRTSIPLP